MPHPDPNPKRDLYDHSHGRKVCRQGREMGAVGGEKKVSEPSLARYLHRNYPFFDVLSKNNVLTENLVHNKKLLNPDIQGNRIPFIFSKAESSVFGMTSSMYLSQSLRHLIFP